MAAVFVVGGNRRQESIGGLALLGVSLDRQHYAGLDDGRLTIHKDRLADMVSQLALRHGLERVVSFGADGFDGHDDHRAIYEAVSSAASHHDFQHLVRSSGPEGECFSGDPQTKLAAMALHASQYDLDADNFWHSMRPYERQLAAEYYVSA